MLSNRNGLKQRDALRLRVFENKMMRRIFERKGGEVTRELRKLHNEELNVLYSSPNIVRVIKLRMRWAEHVARMGERKSVYRILVEKLEGKNHLGDPRVDGRITLRRIFRKWDVGVWTGSSWLRIGTGGGHL
jgi:ribosomal protein L10